METLRYSNNSDSFEKLENLMADHSIDSTLHISEPEQEYFRVLSGSIEENDEDNDLPKMVRTRPLKSIFSTASGTGMCIDPFILNQMSTKNIDPSEKVPVFLQEMGQTHPIKIVLVSSDHQTKDILTKQVSLIGYMPVIIESIDEAKAIYEEGEVE